MDGWVDRLGPDLMESSDGLAFDGAVEYHGTKQALRSHLGAVRSFRLLGCGLMGGSIECHRTHAAIQMWGKASSSVLNGIGSIDLVLRLSLRSVRRRLMSGANECVWYTCIPLTQLLRRGGGAFDNANRSILSSALELTSSPSMLTSICLYLLYVPSRLPASPFPSAGAPPPSPSLLSCD